MVPSEVNSLSALDGCLDPSTPTRPRAFDDDVGGKDKVDEEGEAVGEEE